jgi:hypothetical protein
VNVFADFGNAADAQSGVDVLPFLYTIRPPHIVETFISGRSSFPEEIQPTSQLKIRPTRQVVEHDGWFVSLLLVNW